MNLHTSYEFPAKPAEFLDRGAHMASRVAGLAAFGLCILSLLYVIAF